MGKELLTLGEIEIKKNKFYRHKTPMFSKDVPYRTKQCRTKVTKFFAGNENFVRRKFLSDENFDRQKILSGE